MRSHPGRTVTIYDQYIPCPVAEAQLHLHTIWNIQNGFRLWGIHPYHTNVFTDKNFAPAEVTNCPDLGIVTCASDVNDQQDPGIQNISDPDELTEQESSNLTGQKCAKSKQQVPQVQVHMTFRLHFYSICYVVRVNTVFAT